LYNELLRRKGWEEKPIPRGQNRSVMTGIVTAHRAGAKSGHMFCVLAGRVYDAFVQGQDIESYLRLRKYHIRGVWLKK
jgi:hypothetical protein